MVDDIGGGRKFYLGGQIIIHCARSAREKFGPRPLNLSLKVTRGL